MFPQQQHITTYFRCQVKITVDNGCQVWEDYDMENTSTSPVETQSLSACPPEKLGVTLCPCGTPFTPASKVNRFCSSACRQASYRKSFSDVTCDCGVVFTPVSEVNLFCSNACRQRVYRLSPAHRACLLGLKTQRRNRRVYQHREKYRACSIGFDSRFGGPVNETVPSVGMLNLKNFSKKAK